MIVWSIIKVVMMIWMIWMIISVGSLTEERKGGSHRQAMTLPLIVIAAITTIIIMCLLGIAQITPPPLPAHLGNFSPIKKCQN